MREVAALERIGAVMGLVAIMAAAFGCTKPSLPGEHDRSASSSAPAIPASSPATMAPLPPATEVAVDEMTRGAPLRIAYVLQDVLVTPDGRRTVLQRPPDRPPYKAGLAYVAMLSFDGGWVGSTYDDMQYLATFHRRDGTFVRYLRGTAEVSATAVSGDGQRVLVGDGTGVRLLEARRPDRTRRLLHSTWDSDFPLRRTPVGFVGHGLAVVNIADAATSDPRRAVLVGPRGERRRVEGLTRVSATSSRLLAGAAGPSPRARAETVVDVQGRVVLHAPGLELIAFSPDGTRVVGSTRRFSRRALVVVSVATGGVLAHLTGRIWSVQWEDERHLLLMVGRSRRDRRQVHIIRASTGGRMETVLTTSLPFDNFHHLTLVHGPPPRRGQEVGIQ